jgi:hypothetical protein
MDKDYHSSVLLFDELSHKTKAVAMDTQIPLIMRLSRTSPVQMLRGRIRSRWTAPTLKPWKKRTWNEQWLRALCPIRELGHLPCCSRLQERSRRESRPSHLAYATVTGMSAVPRAGHRTQDADFLLPWTFCQCRFGNASHAHMSSISFCRAGVTHGAGA